MHFSATWVSLVGQLEILRQRRQGVQVRASLHMHRLEMALFRDVTEQPY